MADPAWYVYVIASPKRDRLQSSLASAAIETLVHYPTPPHLQPAYADLGYSRGAFPIAEQLAATVLSLPVGPHLQLELAEKIAAAVRTHA